MATAFEDFDDPRMSDSYYLCLYDTGQPAGQQLVSTTTIEAGGLCAGKPCWKASGTSGFGFKDKEPTLDGAAQLQLKAGVDGKAAIQFKGKGVPFEMPTLGTALHLVRRRGDKKATVAVARSLLVAAYHVLRSGVPFRDLGPDHFDRVRHDRVHPGVTASRTAIGKTRFGRSLSFEAHLHHRRARQ